MIMMIMALMIMPNVDCNNAVVRFMAGNIILLGNLPVLHFMYFLFDIDLHAVHN